MMSAGAQPFVLSRELAAPRERVWHAFTDLDSLKEWFGPEGFAIPEATLDLRPDGLFHYAMQGPVGPRAWGRWVFEAIEPPERLVMTVSFSDADGGVARHPMSPDWPLYTRSTATFEDLGGTTRLTLHWEPVDATALEQAVFNASHAGMEAGWTGTLDQLARYLAVSPTAAG